MTDRIAPRYVGLPVIVDGSEAIASDRLAGWWILQELAGLRG